MKTSISTDPEKTPHYGAPTNPAGRKAGTREAQSRPAIAPFQPAADLVGLGITMADQVINARSWERLRPYFADANSKDENIRRNGAAVMLGVAMRAAALLCALKERGTIRFSGSEMMTQEDVIYTFKTDQNRFYAALNGITDTLARTLEAVPSLKIEKRAVEETAPAPIPVTVVGLPTRVTTTEIERDAAGDIKRSTHIEVDLEKHVNAV